MAPPHVRGALNILFQLATTIGILVAQMVNLAVLRFPFGWRLSLAGAGIPAVLLLAAAAVLPDTPVSLHARGFPDDALKVLWRSRGGDDEGAEEEARGEMAEIVAAAERAEEAGAGGFGRLFTRAYAAEATIAVFIPIFQQLTGEREWEWGFGGEKERRREGEERRERREGEEREERKTVLFFARRRRRRTTTTTPHKKGRKFALSPFSLPRSGIASSPLAYIAMVTLNSHCSFKTKKKKKKGINFVMFFATALFTSIGSTESVALIQTVVIGVINVLATLIAIGLVDRAGRRPLLFAGGLLMGCAQFALGIALRFLYSTPPLEAAPQQLLSKTQVSGVLAIILIFVIGFALSWGPLGWLLPSEVQPIETRAAGMGLSTALNLAMTFAIAQAFLTMLCHLKWGVFVFFGVCIVAMTVFVFLLVPETKGVLLEDMAALWESHPVWKRVVGKEARNGGGGGIGGGKGDVGGEKGAAAPRVGKLG